MRLSLPALCALLLASGLRAQVTPNSLFTWGAVLQRDAKVPVWGSAASGEKVTVTFKGQTLTALAKRGRWRVFLQPMPADERPAELVIAGSNRVVVGNVVVGDVWVASGQSNMERSLGPTAGQQDLVGWKEEAARAKYPLLRQYYMPKNYSRRPVEDGGGSWNVCSPETAKDFSAVGYYFARDIHRSQGVPVGLLFTAWGGTPAEVWASGQALKAMPDFRPQVEAMAQGKLPEEEELYARKMATWFEANDPGAKGSWQAPAEAGEGWTSLRLPALLPEDFDGVAWYRKELTLSAAQAAAAAWLNLGQLDDFDTAWVNGERVGGRNMWNEDRRYALPPGLLKAGKNLIAVRLLDAWGKGGWLGKPEELRLELKGAQPQDLPLAGDWLFRLGRPLAALPEMPANPRYMPSTPSLLFNAMVRPLLPFPIKGALWYQGESNAGRARQYRELFPLLIADWRKQWGRGDFPFLFVQIAPWKGMGPEIREAQLLTLAKSPNTAMAVTADVGDAQDIHPPRKEPVGQRLALAARALAYGEKVPYSGPLYDSMRLEGGKALLGFRGAAGGLKARGGALRGFTVAGADGAFVPARAQIRGESVEVWSEKVKQPAAVRYGWDFVPDGNLTDGQDLPASPFRTDVD